MEKCPHKRERHWYKNEQNICNNTKYELYSINCYFGSFVVKVFLKPAPRIFSYVLWLAAFLRLLCPIALHTDWGLIPAEKLVEIGDSKTFVWENDDGRLKGFKELYEVYNSYDLERINDTEGAENVWYKGKEYSLQKVNGFLKKQGAFGQG